MNGGEEKEAVFRSEDLDKTQANSEKEYFVNVTNDPFQKWLTRQKPTKVKVVKDFSSSESKNETPSEAPKVPQCRTTIRLTTERLRQDGAKYRSKINSLALLSTALALVIISLTTLYFFDLLPKKIGEKTVTKIEYRESESTKEEKEDLCLFYEEKMKSNDQTYEKKYAESCEGSAYENSEKIDENLPENDEKLKEELESESNENQNSDSNRDESQTPNSESNEDQKPELEPTEKPELPSEGRGI